MPPVFIWIVGTLWAGGLAASVLTTVLSLGFSLVLGQISKLFVKGPSASSLSHEVANRTVTSRQFKD